LNSTTISIKEHFHDFLSSSDTLRIYHEAKLIFSSKKDRVVPLLEYIGNLETSAPRIVILDKIMGNAAALLGVKAGAEEVYSPMGSQLGIDTLKKFGIRYHLKSVVPFIQKPDSEDMCFMEKLSVGKTPDEFYTAIKAIIK
jgi:hypothetical protein